MIRSWRKLSKRYESDIADISLKKAVYPVETRFIAAILSPFELLVQKFLFFLGKGAIREAPRTGFGN